MPTSLWLEWEKSAAGYRISKPEPSSFDAEEDREPDMYDIFLTPKHDDTVIYRPFQENSALFMTLAEVSQTPEGVKAFADRFGLLLQSPKEKFKDSLPISLWLKSIKRIKAAVDLWRGLQESGNIEYLIEVLSREAVPSADMVLRLVNDPLQAAIYLRPDSLGTGIWLQFLECVANNARLKQCARCQKWIAYGSGTGRRESSKFCSSACRRAAWKSEQESRN